MTSIIAGSGLGLFNTSANLLGTAGNALPGRSNAVYVNSTTGNLVVQGQDEYLASLGLDTALIRTYNSQGQLNDDNGDNWCLNVASLVGIPSSPNTAGSSVTKRFGDGAEILYTYDAAQGLYVSTAGDGAHDAFSYNSTTQQWIWTDGGARVSETYTSTGQLFACRDVDGNTTTYLYTGSLLNEIRTASDQGAVLNRVYLDYTGSNLTQIRTATPEGTQTKVRYTYDAQSRLTQVLVDLTPADNNLVLQDLNSDGLYETVNGQTYVTTYTYDGASRRIASITNGDGTGVSFTYAQAGSEWRLASLTDGEGKLTSFTYNQASGGVPVTATANNAVLSTTETQTTTVTVAPYYAVQGSDTWPLITQTVYGTSNTSAVSALQTALGNPALTLGAHLTMPQMLNYTTTNPASATANNGLLSTAETQTNNYNLNTGALTTPAIGWSASGTLLENTAGTAASPQFAFGQNGNGLAVWIQSNNVYTSSYTKATNNWSTPVLLETITGTASTPSLTMSANGNALVVWRQTVSSVGSIYARRYINGVWDASQSAPSLLESGTANAIDVVGAINDLGQAMIVFRQLANGTTAPYNLTAVRYAAGAWQSATSIETNSNDITTAPSIALDAQGNAAVLWLQKVVSTDTNAKLYYTRFDAAGNSWSAPTNNTFQTSTTAAVSTPEIAFDGNGNGIAVWIQSNNLYTRAYTRGNNSWSAARLLENVSTTVSTNQVSLSMSSNGNALVTWKQGATNVYARRYIGGVWQNNAAAQDMGDLVSNATGTVNNAVGAINNAGQASVVFVQADAGAINNVYAKRHDGSAWQSGAPVLIENNANSVSTTASTSTPSVALDANGNATTLWIQSDGSAASVYYNGYNNEPAAPYYAIQSGNTWDSITNALYGTSNADAVTQLRAALGYASQPLPAVGVHLAGFPATLTVTSNITVAPYYTVQTGNTWTSITQTVYGTSNANAVSALQTALGNPPLTVGAHLTMPQTLTYNVTSTTSASANNAVLSTTETQTTTVTVAPYYTVQASDNWESVAQSVYGTSSPSAISALQTALGTTTLTVGAHLTMPQTLTYSATEATGGLLEVRDALNNLLTYRYDNAGRLREVIDAAGGSTLYDYDGADNLISVTDANNHATVMEYDSRGNLTQKRDAAGNTVRYTYDPSTNTAHSNRLLTETVYLVADPDGAGSGQPTQPLTTRYVYDGEGHLRFVISAQGGVTEHRYYTNGNLQTTIRYAADQYDLTGLGETQAPSDADLTTWATAPARDRTKTERSDYDYDFRGQVKTVTTYAAVDASGNGITANNTHSVTQFVYDQRGNLLKTIDARGWATADTTNPSTPENDDDYVTTYAYDGLGRVFTTTQWVSATQTRTTITQYEDRYEPAGVITGGRLLTTAANGLITTSVFDRRGLLVSMLRSDNQSPDLGITQYKYDDAGRLRITINSLGNKTHVLYDAAGRLMAAIDATGNLAEMVYDPAGNMVQSIRYALAVSSANLALLADGNNNPTTTTLAAIRPAPANDAANRITRTIYDASNQAVFTITPTDDSATQGYVTRSIYDGAGRLTDVITYVSPIETASLPALPTSANVSVNESDSGNRRTRYFYDAEGKLLATLDAEGYLTEQAYNAAGELKETIGYAKSAAIYSAPGVLDVSATQTLRNAGSLDTLRQNIVNQPGGNLNDQRTQTFYNAKGQVTGILDAEGYVTEYRYDLAGNVTQQIRYADKPVTYTGAPFTPGANDHVTISEYNGANQITQVTTNPNGIVTRYTYDNVGNLIQTDKAWNTAEVRTTQARYDTQGRVTGELTAQGSVELALLGTNPPADQVAVIWRDYGLTHSYDVGGRRTSTTDENGNKALFYYDTAGRLRFTVTPADNGADIVGQGEVNQSVYNAFGDITDSYRYTGRISTAGLTGGVITQALIDRIAAAAQTLGTNADAHTHFNYTLRGAVKEAIAAPDNASVSSATRYTYNAFSELSTLDRPALAPVTYLYDRRGLRTDTYEGARHTTATYDAFGRTTQTVDANGIIRRVGYDRLGRAVTTTLDPSGLNLGTTTSYDAFSRTYDVIDAHGAMTSYRYDDADRSFTLITPEGVHSITRFNRHGETHELEVLEANGTRVRLSSFEYDRNGNLTAESDGVGTTTHSYDRASRRLLTRDASGHYTSFTYDAANRLLTRTIDPRTTTNPNDNPSGLNLTTTYRYDGQSRMARAIDANGIVTETTYDAKGQLTDVIVDPSGLNLHTTYTYDAQGKTLTVTEVAGRPETRQTRYEYDSLGRRTLKVQDNGGMNIRCVYVYDANDNLITQTEAEGTADAQVTRYVYDAANRLTVTIDALGLAAEAAYDANGNVVATLRYATLLIPATLAQLDTTASAQQLAFVRANLITANSEERGSLSVYDRDNRPRYVIDALGYVTETKYNAAGQVTETIAYANALNSSAILLAASYTQAQIDAMNPDQLRAALGLVLNANTIAAGITPDTSTTDDPELDERTQYAYDAAGRMTSVTKAVGTPEQFSEIYAYDEVGNSIRHTNGRGHSEWFAFDNANRLSRKIDASGYVSTYTYDDLGYLKTETLYMTAVALPSANDDRWAYSGHVPNPAPNTDAVSGDRTTSYTYDHAGRLDTKIAPSLNNQAGVITDYVYDALGGLTDTIEAQGLSEQRTIHSVYDKLGRLTEQTSAYGTAEAATSRFTYDRLGNQRTILDPRGVELAERDTAWAQAERVRLGYSATAASLTSVQRDALKALYTTTQEFDLLNRKTAAIDALSGRTDTLYNAFGDIVKVTDPNRNAGYFYTDAQGRVTFQIDAEGYTSETIYDAFGNARETIKYANRVQGSYNETTKPEVLPSSPTGTPPTAYLVSDATRDQHTLAKYDALNRTTRITDPENYFETFTYDAQGNVTTHIDKNESTFTYEYDAKGNKTAEHLPIASTNAQGQLVQVVNRYEYDAAGSKTRSIEAQGLPEERVTQYVYDKNNRVVETAEPQALVAVEVPSVGGSLALGAVGTANYTVSQTVDYIDLFGLILPIAAHSTLSATWPAIVGYPSDNIKVVWNTGSSLGNPFAIVGPQATSATVTGANGQLVMLSGQYQVSIYKQTTAGDVLITSTTASYALPSDGNGSTSAASQIPNILHFSGQPSAGATMRVSYWPVSNSNNITEFDISSYSPGTFSGMPPGALSGDYGYGATAFDAQGQVLSQLTGTFSVVGGVVLTTAQGVALTSGQLQTPHVYNTCDARGNLIKETDAKGYSSYHYYDANNRKIGTVDAERYVHRYFYDATGNLIAERTYDQAIPAAVLDLSSLPDPQIISGMDATAFRETSHRYDAANRLVESKTQAVLVYDRVNGLRTQSITLVQQYDANGNLTVRTDANGNRTYSFYDRNGNKILEVDALGYVSARSYDANGNVTQERRYASVLSAATRSTLSAASNPTTLETEVGGASNPDNRVTSYTYDRMNRCRTETLASVAFATVNSTNGALTEQTGDLAAQYLYDGLGNRKVVIQSDGSRTDYDYDGLSRLTREQGAAFTDFENVTVRSATEYSYYGVNNVKTMTRKGKSTADDQVTTYEYDAHGNVTSETDPLTNPVYYFYDLNGNIAVKRTRRVNPDGTLPSVDTRYTYNKLNRQLTTQDAKNFVYHAKYDAHGEIVAKGLNNVDREYYEYDKAGQLIKTNKGDGVDRAYLYDANGNETAKIQSAIQDTDLQPLTIGQIAALSSTLVQRTESVYDARNQLLATHQAPIEFTGSTVGIQDVWVDVLDDPFSGGTITPAKGGTANYTVSQSIEWTDFFGLLLPTAYYSSLSATWSPIVGYGDGNIKVVWSTGTALGERSTIVGAQATSASVTGSTGATYLTPGQAYSVSIYKQTPTGDVLITSTASTYSLPSYGDGSTSASSQMPSLLHFSGQRSEAETLQLWLWPVGGAKPATHVTVPKLTTAAGAPVAGHFAFDWSSYAFGDYSYEFKTIDAQNNELEYVRGVLSKQNQTTTTFWESPAVLEQGTGAADLPAIAANSQGDAVAVWRQLDSSGKYNLYANRYVAGQGWQTEQLIESDNSFDANPAQVSIDEDGNATAIWAQMTRSSTFPFPPPYLYNLFSARYVVGSGWQPPVPVVSGSAQVFSVVSTGDPQGNISVVWSQLEAGQSNIYSRRYTPAQGWGSSQLLHSMAYSDTTPRMCIKSDPNGNLAAVWTQRTDGSSTSVWSSYFSSASNQWSAVQMLDSGIVGVTVQPDLAIENDGDVFVAWNRSGSLVSRRFAAGQDWQSTQTIYQSSVAGGFESTIAGTWGPKIAVDPFGNAIATWASADGTSHDSIWANRYVNGSGWQSAQLLETDNTYFARGPQIVMDRHGNAVVAWAQSDTTKFNILSNYYRVGVGWQGVQPVESAAGGASALFSTNLVLDGMGRALAVWGQSDGTRVNMYASHFMDPQYAVLSKYQHQIQPIVTPGDTVTSTIVRSQTYNAFGEVLSELDGRGNALTTSDQSWAQAERVRLGFAALVASLTEADKQAIGSIYTTQFKYDQRGQLVEKQDPETNATRDNGVIDRVRPTTRYYYDALGRTVGTRDPNQVIDASLGSSAQRYDAAGNVVAEYSPYGDAKNYGYDVFGNRRYVVNVNERTDFLYNKNNQLVRLDRPTDDVILDASGNPNAARYELYEYDEAGRRIKRTNALGYSERTYYDDIGRVSRTVSLGGTSTSYRYIYDAANGGTTTITTLGDGKTLEDTKSYFGKLLFHKDLGNRTYRYFYNEAGWLTHQIGNTDPGLLSLASARDLSAATFDPRAYVSDDAFRAAHPKTDIEQYIRFNYYHNGYLKEMNDLGIDTNSKFEYDANGNRIFEGYYQGGTSQVYYQWSHATYDELNRVIAIRDPKYSMGKFDASGNLVAAGYEYDANSNRRHIYARYHDGLNNDIQRQDHWYTYDAMNRFLVTKGRLSGTAPDANGEPVWNRGAGAIEAGVNGYAITYNAASQRASATYQAPNSATVRETYIYSVDGLLERVETDPNISDDGISPDPTPSYVSARRYYDALGNVKQYFEDAGNGITRTQNYTYNGDGKITTESNGQVSSTYTYDDAGNLNKVFSQQSGANISTFYQYAYWDFAKQSEIRMSGQVTQYQPDLPWQDGFSRFTYDANGHLTQVSDMVADRHLKYRLDAEGRILQRNELIGSTSSKTQYYYYLNGIGIGDAGSFSPNGSRNDYATLLASREMKIGKIGVNTSTGLVSEETTVIGGLVKPVTSADFDYNFQPVNDQYPATTPGSYTVRAGDTLQSVALAVWGDASLWYLIADANGLPNNPTLIAGQTLVIPNVIANIHNNASTFRVYNPGELIGDTTPTLPEAPPPPQPKEDKCIVFKQIIVIIVAIVVAYYTGMWAKSLEWGAWAAAAIGAAAGSAASQVVAMGLGLQDKFSWKAVAVSALTAGLTKGLGVDQFGAVARQIASNVLSQGVNILLGQQERFSWANLAVSAITAPINSAIDAEFGANENVGRELSWGNVGKSIAGEFLKSTTRQAATMLVNRGGKMDWSAVAVDSFGNGIGNSIVAGAKFNSTVEKLTPAQRAHYERMRTEQGYSGEVALPHVMRMTPEAPPAPAQTFAARPPSVVEGEPLPPPSGTPVPTANELDGYLNRLNPSAPANKDEPGFLDGVVGLLGKGVQALTALAIGAKELAFGVAKLPFDFIGGLGEAISNNLTGRTSDGQTHWLRDLFTNPFQAMANSFGNTLESAAFHLTHFNEEDSSIDASIRRLLNATPVIGRFLDGGPSPTASGRAARTFYAPGINQLPDDVANNIIAGDMVRVNGALSSITVPYVNGTFSDTLFGFLNLNNGASAHFANEVAKYGDSTVNLFGHSGGVQVAAGATSYLGEIGIAVDHLIGAQGPTMGQYNNASSISLRGNAVIGSDYDLISGMGSWSSYLVFGNNVTTNFAMTLPQHPTGFPNESYPSHISPSLKYDFYINEANRILNRKP